MFLNVDDHVQVSGRPAAGTRFAFALQPQPLPRGDTGRDLQRQLTLLLDAAGAAAGQARLGDDAAHAAALPARSCDGEEALLVPDLAGAATPGAGDRLVARHRAGAIAR